MSLRAGLLIAVACCLSFVVTFVVRGIARRYQVLDRPNGRSSHVTPTPRLGGIGVVTGLLFTAFAVLASGSGRIAGLVVLGATAVVSLLGFVDDVRPLPARVRFGVQVGAAVAVVWSSATSAADVWMLLPNAWPSAVAVVVSMLWIVWMTNLYNFMDGIDGLAGGQALIGGGAVAAAAVLGGATDIAVVAALLAAAALGFLRFNFPPASIFMGDVGSTAIGFFVASIPFLPNAGVVSVEVVAIAFSMFILDASVTLLRRLLRGERFYEAHRSHYYQRLLKYGVAHRSITLVSYAAMVVAGAAAIAYANVAPWLRLPVLFVPIGTFAGLAIAIATVERRHGVDLVHAHAPGGRVRP